MAKPKRGARRPVKLRAKPVAKRKPRNIEPAWESPPEFSPEISVAIDALKAMQENCAGNPTGAFDPARLDPIIALLTKATGK